MNNRREKTKYRRKARKYDKEYMKRYLDANPWARTSRNVRTRCNIKKGAYYKARGIRNFLSMADFKHLWFRDKGWLLKQPSIDRINNDGDYTLENSKYIELVENRRQGGRIGKPTRRKSMSKKLSEILEKVFDRGFNHGFSKGQSSDGETYAVNDAKAEIRAIMDKAEKEMIEGKKIKRKSVWVRLFS